MQVRHEDPAKLEALRSAGVALAITRPIAKKDEISVAIAQHLADAISGAGCALLRRRYRSYAIMLQVLLRWLLVDCGKAFPTSYSLLLQHRRLYLKVSLQATSFSAMHCSRTMVRSHLLN